MTHFAKLMNLSAGLHKHRSALGVIPARFAFLCLFGLIAGNYKTIVALSRDFDVTSNPALVPHFIAYRTCE